MSGLQICTLATARHAAAFCYRTGVTVFSNELDAVRSSDNADYCGNGAGGGGPVGACGARTDD
jgi:hypothetical protein